MPESASPQPTPNDLADVCTARFNDVGSLVVQLADAVTKHREAEAALRLACRKRGYASVSLNGAEYLAAMLWGAVGNLPLQRSPVIEVLSPIVGAHSGLGAHAGAGATSAGFDLKRPIAMYRDQCALAARELYR